ncbi:putative DNA methylase [Dissulfuribacter thermophilus]|uniref:site-specific DNA-methyltransferase (adenine-specific) n=1 Tax=Dissulfuribacter thermophilus TaxID=1156395 RepID=A0A1B9F6G6_9BACT|nr:site-specific DNA-methyltransferase [Dissulfuribacter thermophilus]OCC15405.1 putative DNA methylase [Dissulfuribacter thermophilus]
MPKKKSNSKEISRYIYDAKRVNNPQVGLVKPETDRDEGKKKWSYDPHIDPALQFDIGRSDIEKLIDDALESGSEEAMREALLELKRMSDPYLNWTGKAERTSFEVPIVSLHVHERIDPKAILETVKKRLKEGEPIYKQQELFAPAFKQEPFREAIEFYKHEKGWANRLIAGDSLLVMNSLLEKESMAGQVQMIYFDPPYGIKYGSNFQPFVNKRDVKDRKDEDLTQEPEMIKAFRDTWELGIHSYLTYLRDRLLLARELLHESGSIFLQISDENVHHVRELMDEVFGKENFVSLIYFATTSGFTSAALSRVGDYLIWYAKELSRLKYRQLFLDKGNLERGDAAYKYIQLENGKRRAMTIEERKGLKALPEKAKIYSVGDMTSQGASKEDTPFEFQGQIFRPKSASHWKANYHEGMLRLKHASRIELVGSHLRYVRFLSDYPVKPLTNAWMDTSFAGFATDKRYVVETNVKVIQRCILMTTDPGDLVFDPTCGSGTTAYVAEKWGRRWITCDTSRVALTLAKQRLMTASFDYYKLRYPEEGLKSGFIYKTVPHITLKSIANNPEIDEIYDRMHPAIEKALEKLNKVIGTLLKEWEVPFEFPEDWPEEARRPFEEFHNARQAMQKEMDESIARNADQEILYDQPEVDKSKARVTGPFTVEAVPFPSVLSLEEKAKEQYADAAIARSGESARIHEWIDELLKTGIRGKGGQRLEFSELEPLPQTVYLHAIGQTKDGEGVVVSFGPEFAPLEQRQVEFALREAETLRPNPKFVIFAAFKFDPEAAKDIDEIKWPGVTLLKAEMNADLLTEDLKSKRSSNDSFWLMGQPDVEVRKRKDGLYEVEVHGFDYFDTKKGELISGGKNKIAMWLLDTDYDERSLLPTQVFFPMAGKKDGWNRLSKDLKANLDLEKLEAFTGTVSLPFKAGENRKIAVKIIDDRGIESLKIIILP